LIKLKSLTKNLGLDHLVQFKKSVHINKIPELMEKVDVGIDPKRNGIYAGETLSVKAMEYIAMGIPLIVARTKAARMYFDHSMVMFFEPENEHDLAKCIIELCSSPQKRKALIHHAEKFNIKHNWQKYEKIYFSLVDHLCLN
jgi:glycosyltransferase involved in cell wall biosynthesis